MRLARKPVVTAIALIVGALHFVAGPGYRGPFPRFVQGYLIDLLLPFAMFLLAGLVLRSRTLRAVLVFGVGAVTETLQCFGVPLFGSTFDPLDYAMFAVGVLGAALFEARVLARRPADGGPRVARLGPLRWAGVGVRTRNADEMDEDTARIPGLWGRFFAEVHGRRVPARAPYGVYSDYESDVDGRYTLTVGVRVGEDGAVSEDVAQVRAPAATYLVFEGKGEMPALVFRLWTEVWDHFAAGRGAWVRAYGVDFEEHRGPDEVAIHVSVREGAAS